MNRIVTASLYLMIVLPFVNANLHSIFRHFEELGQKDITVRVKRNPHLSKALSKTVTFAAHGQYFFLTLTPGSPIIDATFKVHVIRGEGQAEPFEIKTDHFYTGYLNGRVEQHVDAVEVDGLWTMRLVSANDVYIVEPLRRFNPLGSAETMVVYKDRDVKSGNRSSSGEQDSFCDEFEFPDDDDSFDTESFDDDSDNFWEKTFDREHTLKEFDPSIDDRGSKSYLHVDSRNQRYKHLPNSFHKRMSRFDQLTDHYRSRIYENVSGDDRRTRNVHLKTTSLIRRRKNIPDFGQSDGQAQRRSENSRRFGLGLGLGLGERRKNSGRPEEELRHDFRRSKRHRESQAERNPIPNAMDTCDVFTLIDFDTYKRIEESSLKGIVSWVVYVYQNVDRLFRKAMLDKDGIALGLKMRALLIFTQYSKVRKDALHFNMANNSMSAKQTITSLTRYKLFSYFCLVHLTTSRTFGGVLGMASIASAKRNRWKNGICASSKRRARNVGFSAPIDTSERRLPIHRYILVMAHEFGHNFGSRHDSPASAECAPGSSKGGKYLMWRYSGLGRDINSDRFSPCSTAAITAVTQLKAHKCFQPKQTVTNICGDGVLGAVEDCDIGYSNATFDPCCTDRCRYKRSALCSPFNYPCCSSQCGVAPHTKTCTPAVAHECFSQAFCSGKDFKVCPTPPILPNNTPCVHNGTCWYGRCVPFCEFLGKASSPPRHLTSCNCDESHRAMCLHCCRDMASGKTCEIMGGAFPEGSPCLLGRCKGGVCQSYKVENTDEPEYLTKKKAIGPTSAVTMGIVFGILAAIIILWLVVGIICYKSYWKRYRNLVVLRKRSEETLKYANSPDNGTQDPGTDFSIPLDDREQKDKIGVVHSDIQNHPLQQQHQQKFIRFAEK